jgi:hypothetical protein
MLVSIPASGLACSSKNDSGAAGATGGGGPFQATRRSTTPRFPPEIAGSGSVLSTMPRRLTEAAPSTVVMATFSDSPARTSSGASGTNTRPSSWTRRATAFSRSP